MTQQSSGKPQEQIWKESLKETATSKGIIPYLADEIERFEAEVKAFRAGQRDATVFQGLRLKQGVYGQRQPDTQMVRVKVPGGILTADALDALGVLTERFVPLKKGHVTTRENFQFHHVPLADTPELMRLIGSVGLSTREACGNTVRNVVMCPLAGVCADEAFDPTPYMAAYVRYFVRHPLTQSLPRKFKTAFSGCVDHDCVVAPLQDYALVGRIREEGGQKRKGFKIYVGGGTSIMPKLGQVLYEFVPVEDFLRVTQAVLTIFNKSDELRKNRMMARIKVLVHRIGIDKLRELVEEELKSMPPVPLKPEYMRLDGAIAERPPKSGPSASGQALPSDFLLWKSTNAQVQKQPGYYAVFVKLPLGDIQAPQFHALADIVRKYTGGAARTTQEQNLALRWAPESSLYEVWQALNASGLAEPGAHTITDVVSCPGTDSCKLGITSSMGLGRAIRQELLSMNGALEDPLVQALHIKMSGCPNGCGQHHIASIGFHGGATRGEGGNQVPAYEVFLGGNYGNGATRYGQRLAGVKVPSRRAPALVGHFLRFYVENRQEGETFNALVDRLGTKPFEAIASEYKEVGPLNRENIELYMDCDKTVLYKVERGEGECAV